MKIAVLDGTIWLRREKSDPVPKGRHIDWETEIVIRQRFNACNGGVLRKDVEHIAEALNVNYTWFTVVWHDLVFPLFKGCPNDIIPTRVMLN